MAETQAFPTEGSSLETSGDSTCVADAGNRGGKLYIILFAVHGDACDIVLDRGYGNIEFLTVYLEFVLTHLTGFFLKLLTG